MAATRLRSSVRVRASLPRNSVLTPAANCAVVAASIFSSGRNVRLLLTRPETDAERTAAVLRGLGHSVFVVPLLRIELVADAAIGEGPWSDVVVKQVRAGRFLHNGYS